MDNEQIDNLIDDMNTDQQDINSPDSIMEEAASEKGGKVTDSVVEENEEAMLESVQEKNGGIVNKDDFPLRESEFIGVPRSGGKDEELCSNS